LVTASGVVPDAMKSMISRYTGLAALIWYSAYNVK